MLCGAPLWLLVRPQRVLKHTPSRFNFWSETSTGSALLFNGLTGALLELEVDEAKIVHRVLEVADSGEFGLDSLEYLTELGFLVPPGFDEVAVLSRRAEFGRTSGRGCLELVLSPTYACNFRCTYCYVEPRPGVMSPETGYAIVRYIEKVLDGYSRVEISWFGGEPLLCLDIVESVTRAIQDLTNRRRVEFTAFVTTNGFLLDAATAASLEGSGVRFLHITIDGNREAHDALRVQANGDPSFDVIVSNLIAALDATKDLRFTLRSNVNHDNVGVVHELMKAIPEGYRRRIQWSVTPIKGAGIVPDQALFRKVNKVVARALELGYQYYSVHLPVGKAGFCNAAKQGNFHIGPDGSLYCCTPTDAKPDAFAGRLHPDGNVDLLGTYADRFRGEPIPSACVECPYLCFCMGGCPLEQGEEKDGSCTARFAELPALIRNLAESKRMA